MNPEETQATWGLVAEFETPDALVQATEQAYGAGYRRMEGYSPIPVHGLDEALHLPKNRIPLLCLCGGILGGLSGFAMEEFANVYHYPLIIGGKPFNSWPNFIPIAYELTILTAAFFTVIGMIVINGLPQPYHPLFNVKQFERASRDGFFLCIEARDGKFDVKKTRQFLEGLKPTSVSEVEP